MIYTHGFFYTWAFVHTDFYTIWAFYLPINAFVARNFCTWILVNRLLSACILSNWLLDLYKYLVLNLSAQSKVR